MSIFKILEDFEKEILELMNKSIDLKLSKIDVSHDNVTVIVGLPGVSSTRDVEVTAYDDRVEVKARSEYFGTITYTVHLPVRVKPETATATLRNGALIITIERKTKAYKVPVK